MISRIATIAPYLFLVAASRQIPHPHCRPAQFGHDFDKRRNVPAVRLRCGTSSKSSSVWELIRSNLSKKSTLPRTRSSVSRQGSTALPRQLSLFLLVVFP